MFLSKYIYGLRWASCIFYGVGRMPYLRFLLLSLGSCFLWVFVLSGAGYFFSGAVIGIIGDFERLGKALLVIVVVGIICFYVAERFWLSKKVEEADPERLQEARGPGKTSGLTTGVSGAHSLSARTAEKEEKESSLETRRCWRLKGSAGLRRLFKVLFAAIVSKQNVNYHPTRDQQTD
jgi:hypothetical protein